jgi:hypothetical protein
MAMLRRALAKGALATLAWVCWSGSAQAADITPSTADDEAQTLTLEWNGDAETVPVRSYTGRGYGGHGYGGRGYGWGGYAGRGFRWGGYAGRGYGWGGYGGRYFYGGYRGFYGYRPYNYGYRYGYGRYYPWGFGLGLGYPYYGYGYGYWPYYTSYYSYPAVSYYYNPYAAYYYTPPVYYSDYGTIGGDVMPYASTLSTAPPSSESRLRSEPLGPPRPHTPTQDGYYYDGGPANPVPLPKADPTPKQTSPTPAPPKGQFMSATRGGSGFAYPAYGDPVKTTSFAETRTVPVRTEVAHKTPR